MKTEEWLCSKAKLCPLISGSNVQYPVELLIDTESYPQPHFNPPSILRTLEAFSGAFEKLHSRRSDVNYVDNNALGTNPVQTDDVHLFAEMLSEDILDAAVRNHGTCNQGTCNHTQSELSKWTISDQEMLAKKLASTIYSNALEELGKNVHCASRKSVEHPNVHQMYEKEFHTETTSYVYSTMHPCDHEVPVTERDDISYRRYTTSPTTLESMVHVGSLDYPDAPPSTPLLPEMMKSRASFTKKLKGGLAKEFLPSTPPPTPKEQQSIMADKITDCTVDKSEFAVRLMHSLSLACSQLGEDNGIENDTRFQSEISNYAAQLSAEITGCIIAPQAGNNESLGDVQVLANHLAEEVIGISLAEVMRCKRENRTSQENPSNLENTTQGFGDTILSQSIPNIPPVEALRDMVGRVITNTMLQAFSDLGSGYLENTTQCLNDTIQSGPISNNPPVAALRTMADQLMTNTLLQAFTELESGSFQHATSKQRSDTASGPVPWKQWNDQYLKSSLYNSHQPQTKGWSNVKCESDYVKFDPRTGMDVKDVFAENIMRTCSLREASNCPSRCKEIFAHSNRWSSSTASQPVIRAFISETLCSDTQELQCVLLWVAASQTGSSTLQIDLTNKDIQQQLCSVSLQSQVYGWTVGHLMTSLLQYCADLKTACRGHSKIRTSLLGHLLLTQS